MCLQNLKLASILQHLNATLLVFADILLLLWGGLLVQFASLPVANLIGQNFSTALAIPLALLLSKDTDVRRQDLRLLEEVALSAAFPAIAIWHSISYTFTCHNPDIVFCHCLCDFLHPQV
jgi:hypothetical protein